MVNETLRGQGAGGWQLPGEVGFGAAGCLEIWAVVCRRSQWNFGRFAKLALLPAIFAVLPSGSANSASAERNLPGHFFDRCSISPSQSGERVGERFALHARQRYEAEMLHPGFIEPCLPTISRTVPTGRQWAYEIKRIR